jgi:hypothetical protein
VFPFSKYRRRILFISWIGLSTIFILINSRLNPNLNKEVNFVMIALLFLVNACVILTRLLNCFGESRKAAQKNRLQKLPGIAVINGNTGEKDIAHELSENIEKANPYSVASGFNPLETYHFLDHSRLLLNKVNEFLSILLNLGSAMIILNITSLTIEMIITYGAIILCMLVVYSFSWVLLKKQKRFSGNMHFKIVNEQT